jgi:hypothetical protein
MIDLEKRDSAKNQLIAAAFMAWQTGAGEQNMGFTKYLERFGLVEPEAPLTTEKKEKIAARSFSKAAQIIALDKRRNSK